MKSVLKSVFLLCVLVIVASFPLIVARAAAPSQALPEATPSIDDLFVTLKSLGGVAALMTGLVNVLKRVGVVKDGESPMYITWFNVFGLVVLLILQTFGQTNMIPSIDAQAAGLAEVITVVSAFIFQMLASRLTHTLALSGVPWIGTSLSKAK